MKRKIILSSGNEHKVREIKEILKDMSFEVVSKNDLGFKDFEVVEDGDTLEENAFKKVTELGKLVKGIIIADDTGLYVDALEGDPGVYSARYAGEPTSDERNNRLLLDNMMHIPMEKRTAVFKTVIAVMLETGEKIKAEGLCKGKIGFEPKGNNGFGYDPLFVVEETGKTFAQMSDQEKNQISHRAKALFNLRAKLEGA